jgi:hypothetical protein
MSKIKDLKSKNPEFLITIDLIELFSNLDPSGTNKYLPFMVNISKEYIPELVKYCQQEFFEDLYEVVNDFDALSRKSQLDNPDIYSYKNIDDLIEAIELGKEKVSKTQIKTNETHVIHEDERWLILMPLTSRSSNVYGKSTKWCTASEDNNFDKYFNQYTENGILVYVIDKSIKDKEVFENKLSKVAIHFDKSQEDGLSMWDSKDSKMGSMDIMKFTSSMGNLMSKINDVIVAGETNKEIARNKGIR